MTTRDEALPAAYSQALDAGSLGRLWTALHVLLPQERVTAAVPHLWRWADLQPLLLEAGRLVEMERAERRVLVLCNPGLGRTRESMAEGGRGLPGAHWFQS